ncbi:hypothetical protein GF360_02860 [candidate division WWE3 bacterium]|nr:hypothetical protein [candidate division WWE3 bacterium]
MQSKDKSQNNSKKEQNSAKKVNLWLESFASFLLENVNSISKIKNDKKSGQK